MSYVRHGGIDVAADLARFVNEKALPGTGVTPETFWSGMDRIVARFAPRQRDLLARRSELQAKIDAWHDAQNGQPIDPDRYRSFLEEIGYIVPEGGEFSVSTASVDDEIARVAGPQLVVPSTNARYALNAANARWWSLYDALYGTDAIGEEDGAERTNGYNAVRGERVIAWGRGFLDLCVPLSDGSHSNAVSYSVVDGSLVAERADGGSIGLADPVQFAGYRGEPAAPSAVLLVNNGLHVELAIDRDHPIGRGDRAGIADIVLESALSAIIDCEDSVATVDAADKIVAYGNWLGMMKADLRTQFEKGGKSVDRQRAQSAIDAAIDGGDS